jgi:hypothetical protein
MKLITFQRWFGLNTSSKPGIAPSSMPWLTHQNRSPEPCAKRCGSVKSTVRIGKPAGARPSPCPAVPSSRQDAHD